VILATALSALALGALPVGAPATPVSSAPTDAHVGLGVPVAGSARLLDGVAVADPSDGGPPWGLRSVKTTRGLSCLQLGRVQDGQLGALGRDHAFGDDGAFHPIPASSLEPISACAPPDEHGTLFAGMVATGVASAAKPGGSCEPRRFVTDAPESELCPDADVRNIYFGALGPQARSITYILADGPHTVPTVGPEGAYLIVLPDTASRDFNGVMSGVVPLNSPITELAFADGTRCAVTERGAKGHCAIPGRAFAPLRRLPAGAARAEVHARAVHDRQGHVTIEVSFRARVAAHGTLEAYEVTLHRAGARQYAVAPGGRDVRRGDRVTTRFTDQRGHRYTGTVTLVRTNPDETGRPRVLRDRVGSFAVNVG
jgi:hypothetical protein